MREEQRTGRDDRQRGDGDTFPRRPPPASFLAPGPSGRYSTERLHVPVSGVLPGWERNDEQPALRETHKLFVCQVRDGDRELPVGAHKHARDGGAVVRRRELCHVRCGQRRILVECE